MRAPHTYAVELIIDLLLLFICLSFFSFFWQVYTEVAQRGAFSEDWDDIVKKLDRDGKESSQCTWEGYTAKASISCKDDTATLTGTICPAP